MTLTREQIEKLPIDELNERVAVDVMGWKKRPIIEASPLSKASQSWLWVDKLDHAKEAALCSWNPAEDIADAMRIFDSEKFRYFQIDRADDRSKKHHVSCSTMTRNASLMGDMLSDTICRAALLAVQP